MRSGFAPDPHYYAAAPAARRIDLAAACMGDFSSPAFTVARAKSAGPRAASCLFPAPVPRSPNDFPTNFAARRAICCASGPFGAPVAGI